MFATFEKHLTTEMNSFPINKNHSDKPRVIKNEEVPRNIDNSMILK